jgi:hypothetical protein
MFIRKLAIMLPAALFALGMTVAVPTESFAQSNKPAAAKKAKKKASKKMKKKAADIAQVRSFG